MTLDSFALANGSDDYADILGDSVTYAHLRVGTSPSDATLIQQYRTAALQQVEQRTNLQLRNGTQAGYLRTFYPAVFPVGPNVNVTAVKYTPVGGGDQVTLDSSSWFATTTGNLARINFKNTPAVDPYDLEGVKIEFSVGFANAAAVPDGLKQAALFLVGHFYENRQEVITGTIASQVPAAADALLSPYRVIF